MHILPPRRAVGKAPVVHTHTGMSATLSSPSHPTDAPAPERSRQRLITLVTAGILLALSFAVVLLRLFLLAELPPGLMLDEGAHGVDALRVLQGEHAVFFPENNGREGMIVYAVALATALLGPSMLALRLPTALASAGTVFAVFWLGQLLFGRDGEDGEPTPWRGLLIGGVGAGLLAVSLGQTIIGRTAYRANLLPLLLTLCLALLWQGWSRRRWLSIALAGACAGLLPYTYIAARFTPFLFLLFGLSFLSAWGTGRKEREGRPHASLVGRFTLLFSRLRDGLLKRDLRWTGLFVGAALLVAGPILIYFVMQPHHFFMRSNQLLVFHPDSGQVDPLGAFLENVREHLLVFGMRGDRFWEHNYPGQPALAPWEALFFWVGVGMAVWRWQRPAYRLLLLWLVILLLPALLAKDIFIPNTLRMNGVVPAVYLLAAVGVWEAYGFLRKWIFPGNETIVAVALGVAAGGLIVAQGVSTHRTYFQQWAVAPEVHWIYKAEWLELVKAMHAQPYSEDVVYLVPDGHRLAGLWEGFNSYTFEYLYHGKTPAFLFQPNTPNLAQKVGLALASEANFSTVRVVEWRTNLVGTVAETERIALLLRKYGRHLRSDDYDSFLIHTFADISLDRPWTFYRALQPTVISYDDGITLNGFALGRGTEQLSSPGPLNVGESRALWMALQWQTAPGLDIDYAISLRLYGAENGGEFQFIKDTTLWRPDHTRTGSGGEAALFDTVVQLDIPRDLLPGDYELRLVVYNAATLEAVIEPGVAEPEVALTRLRLAELP